ncbi:L-lactate dehydrogenase B chain [Drosophila elegans]|uniref:L-lactate dehydrogenase B chain n=1 Tax=Drosophila elegans TaxID=30023 RepID=UPI0007E64C18|nr:L-lactate dehydrogenase B chain [Drosophila elegans]XP_017131884.1 L-lactate dehydrogenase B chain [Drosophila elegans]XP_017131886.1 L-lactate dehydrogenase B chain [Drosophila elegans]
MFKLVSRLNTTNYMASSCKHQPHATKPQGSAFNKRMKPMKEFTHGKIPKISVVGAGQVGTAISVMLLLRNLTKYLVILDVNYELAKAEALDFQHGAAFLGDPRIVPCGDGSHSKDSDLVIITAGARPAGKDRSRMTAMSKTVEILKEAVPKLVELSPKATFIVISNPADVMTYAVQRIGKLPKHRCFTTGCHLDSMRFRNAIAGRLRLPASQVQGFVIGEHGNSGVPAWSTVSIGGIRLKDVVKDLACGEDPENWFEINGQVASGGLFVGKVKGYTNWAIATTCTDIVEAMCGGRGKIASVGTDMRGINDIKDNVVLSLPCLVQAGGISHVFELPLTDVEKQKLHASAEILLEAQCFLKL